MYDYPVIIHEEAGKFIFSCPDIPEACCTFEKQSEAEEKSLQAITEALSLYVEQYRHIPEASIPAERQAVVKLPIQVVAKIALWNAIQSDGIRVAGLARMLDLSHTVASRLVDFQHNSKIEQLEAAFKTLNTDIKNVTRSRSWIVLPHGGPEAGFYVERLIDELRRRQTDHMVIGAVPTALAKVKTHSLDYWLRSRYARTPNTKQATAAVINQLLSTGHFDRCDTIDPETGRNVDSIVLTNSV
ncbi:type II toxin-antitoxin system HicB family antitoxin [Pseudomonas sp. MPFS]|uniref:type II toxin-antitoxin system HicB family antitoxin n=1 Tax=Pseudomonas sp. MPFS TaxID=2795724 RepID=UPI001F12FF69|nr:type II toxin-antitoxin system HicB family antitoxin [Pseudomonas sp. MPFS]UMZ14117.1 type II toxin-antitoxin system HicB family antitoxin [Pseudomonas sp. MPFS]